MRLLALAAVIAAALPAQQVVAPANESRGAVLATKQGLVLPAGEFSIEDLIHAVAGYLCRNYVFDDSTVERVAGFRLQRSISLDAIGSEEMLYTLLAARNLVALPIDELRGVYQITPLSSDQRSMPITNVPWRTSEEILRRPRLRELVMTAVQLQHINADQMANGLRAQFSLQGMWQPGVPTAASCGANTLLLHGYRDQIAPLLLIVQQIDKLTAPTPAPEPAATALAERVETLERELAELRALVRTQPSSPTKSSR